MDCTRRVGIDSPASRRKEDCRSGCRFTRRVARQLRRSSCRITSYNVCYTKLLRLWCAFSHPDCTVGPGITPGLHYYVCSRALTAGREFHPAPKTEAIWSNPYSCASGICPHSVRGPPRFGLHRICQGSGALAWFATFAASATHAQGNHGRNNFV